MSFENLSSSTKRRSLFGSRKKNKERVDESFSIWGSLQELRQSDVLKEPQHAMFLEGTYSEPNLNQNLDEVSSILLPEYITVICSTPADFSLYINYFMVRTRPSSRFGIQFPFSIIVVVRKK
jgi:hypothetical protein